MITQSQLKEVLHYNKDTGIFTWVKSGSGVRKTLQAGSLQIRGYSQITINNKSYYAHRLAWLYIKGVWPKTHIDHINGIKYDNRIENLRDIPQRKNCQNYTTHRGGKLVGCYFKKQTNKWIAQIRINNKVTHIGYYNTELEAHKAYLAMEWILSKVEKL